MTKPEIIVALDMNDRLAARSVITELAGFNSWFKVGKQLFVAQGGKIVEDVIEAGSRVFLDLKFHDIPNTVANATLAAADLGIQMVNLHASGGRRMMEAAAESIANHSCRPLLIAVTVLTSMSEDELQETGVPGKLEDQVLRLARMARESGLDGVVCSAQEAAMLKSELGPDFLTVTPGIRPAWSVPDDQKRVVTPADGARLGVDYMVIGRPITKHNRPMEAYEMVQDEIDRSRD